MATLNTTNIKHASSSSNNIVLASDGKVTFPQNTGNILQVVSTTKTDSFSATSTSTAADITGLSVTITPSSSSNKVFVMYSVHVAAAGNYGGQVILLVRDSTNLALATDVGSRSAGTSLVKGNETYGNCVSQHFLDSPSTTSATTYKLQHKDASTNNTIYINRTGTDSNDAGYQRITSSITVMEVAA